MSRTRIEDGQPWRKRSTRRTRTRRWRRGNTSSRCVAPRLGRIARFPSPAPGRRSGRSPRPRNPSPCRILRARFLTSSGDWRGSAGGRGRNRRGTRAPRDRIDTPRLPCIKDSRNVRCSNTFLRRWPANVPSSPRGGDSRGEGGRS